MIKIEFNPSRLDLARRRRLLTKKELASKIGVNSHTVSLWHKGATIPTRENVEACARELKYPSQFFYGPDLAQPMENGASFRSQASMSAKIRDAAFGAGSLGFMIADWTDARFQLPKINVPDLHLFTPEETAARTLRQEWGLGEKPISNMIQLLESKGVRVFSLAEETAKVNAFSLWKDGKPYVFLNTFKTAESSRFDAAHELAHLVLHQDAMVKGREAEDQANRFASAFLMPQSDILGYLPRVVSLDQLKRAKHRWKVSLAALAHRCHRLGIISDWKYRDFCISIVRHGYNRNEPDGIERERSEVWNQVIKSLWTEKITQADIADQLNIPLWEVSGLFCGVLDVPAPENITPPQLLSDIASIPEDEMPRATA